MKRWPVLLLVLSLGVHAQSGRAKYYRHTYSGPFTVQSIVTLTGGSATNVLHSLETIAVNSRGDLLRLDKKFDSPTAAVPYASLARLTEAPDGELYATLVAGQDTTIYGLRGKSLGFFEDHRLVENRCSSVDPGVVFLHSDSLTINGVAHPVFVVEHKSEQPVTDATFFYSAEVDCIELKSVVNYVDPNGKHGTSIREPVSFSLGEPDATMFAAVKNDIVTAVLSPTPQAFEAKALELRAAQLGK